MSPSRRTHKSSALRVRRVRRAAPLLCLALAASLAYLFAPSGASAPRAAQALRLSSARVEESKARPYVPGEIIVRFRGESKAAEAEAALVELTAEGGARVPVRFERPRGFEVVRGLRLARVEEADTESALASLRSRADVLYAEPNYIRRKLVAPNDPRFSEQWSLKNPPPGSGNGHDIDAEAAWDVTTGDRSVVVGVIDEGVDISHPDLQANIWTNAGEVAGNGVDDDGNGFVDDIHGWDFFHNDASVYDGHAAFPADETDAHGTHVAGTIGAVGNNAAGVAGVNWQVSLMPLKILGTETESAAPSSVLLTVRAYAYAKAMRDLYLRSGGTKGANLRVLNNSYGGVGRSQAELDAIRALGDSGILFVAAAGNDGVWNDNSPSYPANYDAPNLISVAAINQSGQLASFSNRGRVTVHMSAPGVNILSTTPGATYAYAEGTSMASPHVAGVAALLCARRPDVTVARMRNALLLSGDYDNFLGFETVTGRSLNAAKALQNLDDTDVTPPSAPASLHADGMNVSWTAPGDDGISGRATLYEIRFSENDLTNPTEWAHALRVAAPTPSDAFTPESFTFKPFYRHPAGYVGIRALDEVGNAGPVAQVHVSYSDLVVDPYVMTESAPSALSTGGTPLGLVGDDKYKSFQLPFNFPFYGFNTSNVTVSTNGVIYPVTGLYTPPVVPDGSGDGADFFSSLDYLTAGHMIAVAWDDLRTDRRAGDDVYVVQPDADRVIFRWQGVTFDTPFGGGTSRGEHPVNFEAELRRDGTVITRYGAGNQQMFPVVGLSDGLRDAYASASHTSEDAAKDLTNAGTVNFDRRKPDTSPSEDLRVTMTSDAASVASGAHVRYTIFLVGYGNDTTDATVTDDLPAGTKFVSCAVAPGYTCSGPAVGTAGRVTFTFNGLRGGVTQTMNIEAEVSAAPGTRLTNTASASGILRDPDTSNNSSSVAIDVLSNGVFMNARSVSARGYHTLALKTDGTVWGWGDNHSGQLFDGSKDESKILPVQLAGLSNVTAIAAGTNFGLALKGDGTVWAWGDNTQGQLGSADAPAAPKNAPVQVKGLSNVTAVAAGASFGLALRGDGTLWAWGSNAGGQLGTGSTDLNPHFTPVFVMSGVASMAAGPAQTYAVKSDGTVWVCGYNAYGMAGQPDTTPAVTTPVQLSGLSGVSKVASSENSSFAIKSDGTLWAWGDNSYGQLGAGGNSFGGHPTPAQVPGLSNVVSVAAGYTYVFAAKADGTLWGWGNALLPASYTPAQITNASNVVQVTAGTTHAALLTGAGAVRTWGANDQGELGDGTNTYHNVWVDVSGLSRVATPTLSPPYGLFWPAVDVTINCATPGAVMHYTVNSFNDPTEADPVIAAGTTLHLTTDPSRVRVRAWKSGSPASAVVEGYYNVFNGNFPPLPNPIDNSYEFVGRHYQDFLSRDADSSGQLFWTNEIESCGASAQCREVKRINVSAAFFLSIEFQETGYFVYRLEKVSFNRLPRFQQFMADTRQTADGVIVNTPGWEQKIEDGKRNFAELWARRVDFKALYDSKSNAAYVDALYANAGVTPATAERDALVAGLAGGTETRASVLRKVADTSALKRQEYNRAFVLMQYFGYLRRDPDAGGYNFWLTKLNSFGGDWRRAEMVKAFITSDEYRHRFGS